MIFIKNEGEETFLYSQMHYTFLFR